MHLLTFLATVSHDRAARDNNISASFRFRVGQPVEVSAPDSNVLVRSIGEPKVTLEQKLAAYDPLLHGGEIMMTGPVGKEIL